MRSIENGLLQVYYCIFNVVNLAEVHVVAKSIGNRDEIGSISCRRWHKYGTGIATVGCIENSIIRDNE
jgi:hypothetical protein